MKIIYTNCKHEVQVSDEDYEDLMKHKWNLQSNGYITRNPPMICGLRSGKIYMHRQIMQAELTAPKLEVDHDDRNRSNNQRSNLAVMTSQQNHQKKLGFGKYKGVSYCVERDRFRAYGFICELGKPYIRKYLGQYKLESTALAVVAQFKKENVSCST